MNELKACDNCSHKCICPKPHEAHQILGGVEEIKYGGQSVAGKEIRQLLGKHCRHYKKGGK